MSTAFPDLAVGIIDSLTAENRRDLVEQLKASVIDRVTFDDLANAGYIYVHQSRPLNVVEQNVIGRHRGETIAVDCGYGVNLDVDNVGRLSGIEVLNPGNLKAELRKRAQNEE